MFRLINNFTQTSVDNVTNDFYEILVKTIQLVPIILILNDFFFCSHLWHLFKKLAFNVIFSKILEKILIVKPIVFTLN